MQPLIFKISSLCCLAHFSAMRGGWGISPSEEVVYILIPQHLFELWVVFHVLLQISAQSLKELERKNISDIFLSYVKIEEKCFRGKKWGEVDVLNPWLFWCIRVSGSCRRGFESQDSEEAIGSHRYCAWVVSTCFCLTTAQCDWNILHYCWSS